MIREALAPLLHWLKEVPTQKPMDVIAFEEARERLRGSSARVEAQANQMGQLFKDMRAANVERRKRTAQ